MAANLHDSKAFEELVDAVRPIEPRDLGRNLVFAVPG
jgi:hypothetical protein